MVEEPWKLYVIVREDLRPGLRMAQAGHAVAEVCIEWHHRAREWRRSGNYMIVLGVPDEGALKAERAKLKNLHGAAFREPDLDGELTAIAYLPHPKDNHRFAHLPLSHPRREWFRRYRA